MAAVDDAVRLVAVGDILHQRGRAPIVGDRPIELPVAGEMPSAESQQLVAVGEAFEPLREHFGRLAVPGQVSQAPAQPDPGILALGRHGHDGPGDLEVLLQPGAGIRAPVRLQNRRTDQGFADVFIGEGKRSCG